MRILGPASALRATVEQNAAAQKGVHERFVDVMLPALWSAAGRYGIDPVGLVAQAYKETGGGNFTGKVKAEFCNPCGLKNRSSLFPGVDDGDQPLAHARFANWSVGAHAHAQHLAAYAGLSIDDLIVDPRYELVVGRFQLEAFEELSGRWAPSATYGAEVVVIARRLQAITS